MSDLSLRELLVEYNKSKGWDSSEDNSCLYETFEECCDVVWQGLPDHHRWYSVTDIVREVPDGEGSRYFEDTSWHCTGDGDISDCGWSTPDIDDLVEVFPKDIVTTIYVTKDKL